MVTLYNVISSDGFIARPDGREDFIPNDLWINFLDLCKEYKTLVIGRKTYDAIQKYGKDLLEPFEKLPIKKIVVTTNRRFHPKQDYIVAHSPEDALAASQNILVSSGPTLNNYLLRKGLVRNIIHHEVPVSIGEGIGPFDRGGFILVPRESAQKLAGVKVKEYQVLSQLE